MTLLVLRSSRSPLKKNSVSSVLELCGPPVAPQLSGKEALLRCHNDLAAANYV